MDQNSAIILVASLSASEAPILLHLIHIVVLYFPLYMIMEEDFISHTNHTNF